MAFIVFLALATAQIVTCLRALGVPPWLEWAIFIFGTVIVVFFATKTRKFLTQDKD
jgi:membrane protein implicated in regulation of membrane protease activity